MTLSVTVVLCLIHVVSAFPALHSLIRRTTTTVNTIDIPLHFDSNGKYAIPVAMSPGVNQQNFNFTFATSTGLTTVAGLGCSSCGEINLYNQSASSTARTLGSNDSASLLGGSYNGSLIKENCDVRTSDGSAWDYMNQTIIVANSQQNGTLFFGGSSGMIGLGTNRLPTTTYGFTPSFSDSIFNQWLQNNMDQESFQFGMDIAPPIATPSTNGASASSPTGSAGTLHWLAPDSSAYNRNALTYKTVQSNQSVVYSTGTQPDWSVSLDGWKASSGGNSFMSAGSMMAAIDPYYTDIYFPARQAQLFNGVISGSSLNTSISTLGSQSQAYEVPCDTKVSMTVNVNDQTFELDESVLITQTESGICFSGIEGWSDTSVDEYIFGALFISQVYLIFNVGRNGTDTVGFAPKTAAQKSTDVGAIVGGTVGGVVGVLLVAAAAFFYIRSRRDRAILRDTVAMVEEYKNVETIQPYMLDAPPAVPPAVPPTLPPATPQDDMGSPGVPHEEDVAPPSYDASEAARSPTVASGPPMRTSKSSYMQLSSMQTRGEEPAGTSQPRIEPNRMYDIEEWAIE